ncbi:MAG TPA: hydroxyacid dehydrogenase [Pseudonocardiaceae bacterium]|nr:hydroxyacid dehydrogenase [Pseudonocardiaceae bacterium]
MGEQVDRPTVVLAMAPHLPARLFAPRVAERLHAVADVLGEITEFGSADAQSLLAKADVLVTGWGAPPVDAAVLAATPRLRAVIHAGGSVADHVTATVLDRGIVVSSATCAETLPVAEYTLAMILLANKEILPMAQRYRAERRPLDLIDDYPATGNFGRTVGIVGASRVGRRVLRLLTSFDLHLLLADPDVTDADAAELGAERVDLPVLFQRSNVISLHAPETRGLVSAELLAAMPDGATLINTSGGALIDHDALLRHLRTGRISAVLDVTEPDLPAADSPLWDLPNVLLTPHAAGALGTELARLGECAVDEVARLAAGEPLAFAVDSASL